MYFGRKRNANYYVIISILFLRTVGATNFIRVAVRPNTNNDDLTGFTFTRD